jgi:N-sulfoglucosamine sulfohydrolase
MLNTLLLLSSLLVLSPTLNATPPLNFVLFLADDISAEDIGAYGHPTIQTPNINRLAGAGLRFANAYLTISSCSPSRCSLISGRYPHNTGAPELHTELPEGMIRFPDLLRQAGYYTVLSGKNHMGNYAAQAFNTVSLGVGPGKEEDWVQLLQERPQDQPFFCWYASTDAHRDWQFDEHAPRYDPASIVIPPYLVDGPKTREDLTGYYHEVSRFDHYIGEVVAELDRQGVLDHTVIIVMADNGRPFPRAKTRLYDSGIKPPFIVFAPGLVSPGVTDSLISSIDLAPTVLALANTPPDARIQGLSFAPVLHDPTAVVRRVAFAEHNWHVYANHERMVRMDDWLYIRNNMPDQQNLCVEAYMGGAGEELWAAQAASTLTAAQRNVFWNPCPPEELYHVRNDPHQLNNLADDPENAAILVIARAQLIDWTTQTGDTIPTHGSPSRDAPPGQPQLDRNLFQRGEMPGDASSAHAVNHPGPQ